MKPMGYAAASLLPDEDVVYQARLHWFIVVGPAILATICVIVGPLFIVRAPKADRPELTFIGVFLLLVAPLLVAAALATSYSFEFAVTTKRVILKTGVIHRRTLEVTLNKVDAVSVDQDLLGRLFDYGSVGISAATEQQPVHFVAAPLRLRKEIQARQTS